MIGAKRQSVLPLVFACLGLVCGCGGVADLDLEALVHPGAPVVLISIDTLRADHLGCYDYPRDTSPRLDELARESFLLRQVYTQSPNTIISHATMLTSLYPVVHGVRPEHGLTDSLTTLAEHFGDAGYATAGYTTHGDWLCARKGFHQGFDDFDAEFRSARAVNEDVLRWLRTRGRGEDPFFLFVHYYDVHSDRANMPYETRTRFDRKFAEDPPAEFNGCRGGECGTRLLKKIGKDPSIVTEEELTWIEARYDGGIAYTDHHVGVILDELRTLGLYDGSWIVITSDHGEEFLDHGRMLHEQPYEEVARVPLIVKPPGGITGRDVRGLAGLIDLVPTLLEGTGLDLDAQLQGRSLLSLLAGLEVESPTVYFNDGHDPANVTVRHEGHALVTRAKFNRLELFDLVADPGQTASLVNERPDVAERLRGMARQFHEEQLMRAHPGERPRDEISDEERERLRSLGYID